MRKNLYILSTWCRRQEEGNVNKSHNVRNVIWGDMSFVGTRPLTMDEWERYEAYHRLRLAIRPGITGLWQVSGRSRITDFDEVVELDRKYIQEWSLWLDLRILAKTVVVVLGKRGAMYGR